MASVVGMGGVIIGMAYIIFVIIIAHVISGGKVVGKWEKVGDMVQSWHTQVVMWLTQQTEQNSKTQWQQGLAINILYIMSLISMY